MQSHNTVMGGLRDRPGVPFRSDGHVPGLEGGRGGATAWLCHVPPDGRFRTLVASRYVASRAQGPRPCEGLLRGPHAPSGD